MIEGVHWTHHRLICCQLSQAQSSSRLLCFTRFGLTHTICLSYSEECEHIIFCFPKSFFVIGDKYLSGYRSGTGLIDEEYMLKSLCSESSFAHHCVPLRVKDILIWPSTSLNVSLYGCLSLYLMFILTEIAGSNVKFIDCSHSSEFCLNNGKRPITGRNRRWL